MNKKLDITKPVDDLVREYPELVNILKGLGFTEIAKTCHAAVRRPHDDHPQRCRNEGHCHGGCDQGPQSKWL